MRKPTRLPPIPINFSSSFSCNLNSLQIPWSKFQPPTSVKDCQGHCLLSSYCCSTNVGERNEKVDKSMKRTLWTQREKRGGGGGVRAKKQMSHAESGLWTMAFQSTSLRSRGLSPIMIWRTCDHTPSAPTSSFAHTTFSRLFETLVKSSMFFSSSSFTSKYTSTPPYTAKTNPKKRFHDTPSLKPSCILTLS